MRWIPVLALVAGCVVEETPELAGPPAPSADLPPEQVVDDPAPPANQDAPDRPDAPLQPGDLYGGLYPDPRVVRRHA